MIGNNKEIQDMVWALDDKNLTIDYDHSVKLQEGQGEVGKSVSRYLQLPCHV